jgi:hypothetical protein
MEQSASWEASSSSASQENPAFYGTQRFITLFTSARHLSLSWARSIQFCLPHPTSRNYVLSSHLRPGPVSGLLLSDFHTTTLYETFLSFIRASCPAHIFIHYIRWRVQIIKLLVM